MFQGGAWPFTPIRLGEIGSGDRLKAIESGCCERTRRPLTILDNDGASRWVWQAVNKLTVFLAH